MAIVSASRIGVASPHLAAQPDTTSTHPYTCNTCQVAFRNADSQRGHMRSDWHRYNLKRRVIALPPITAEIFSEKVLQAQASSTAAASKASFERPCTVCQKTFYSENAYQNHINSQKHKAKEMTHSTHDRQAGDDETNSVMSSTFSLGETTNQPKQEQEKRSQDIRDIVSGLEETTIAGSTSQSSTAPNVVTTTADADENDKIDIALTRCLFCNYDSPSVSCNAVHMERIHGMFIPEKDYLVDLDGLIKHLQHKVHYYHECLACGKLKPTGFGLQTHMRDTGHCRIPFEDEREQLDIGEFYDFTSTYSDVEEALEDTEPGAKIARGIKLGARRSASVENNEDVENGDGWETDSSESSLDSADLTAVPLDQRQHMYDKLNQHPHHAHTDPRPHHNKDGWHSHAHKHIHAAYYSEYELHLPSGRTAGHRSLNRYFKQNLHNHPSAEERIQRAIEAAEASESDTEMEDHQVVPRQSRGRAAVSGAHGEAGMLGVTSEKRREVRAAEIRSRKVEERERRKFQWGNNKQGNHQKHFRDPLLQ